MKTYTIETAAQAIRVVLRAFSAEQRIKILSLATRALDDDIPDNTRERITAALEKAGNRVGAAAAILGCSRRTLQRLMRKLDMSPGREGRPTMREAHKRTDIVSVAGGAIPPRHPI